jgi:hypothetical protein
VAITALGPRLHDAPWFASGFALARFALGAQGAWPEGMEGGRDDHTPFFPASSQGIHMRFQLIMGSTVARPKHVPWSAKVPFSGTITDFSELRARGVVLLRCKPSTVGKVRAIVALALLRNALSPAQASSLRGKLLWVWLYTKFGLSEMSALVDRQYGRDAGDASSVDDEGDGGDEVASTALGQRLHDALWFVKGMLSGALPDVVLRAVDSDERPVVILSDAMWKPFEGRRHGAGRMAFLIWIPLRDGGGKIAFAEAEADDDLLMGLARLREQKTFVHPLEALAMLGPYVCSELASSIEGRAVLHFADNKSANGAAVRAYSGARDFAAIVRAMQIAWANLRVDPWVEYVRSAANLADWPSRGDFGALLAMGAVRVSFHVPVL